MSDATEAEAWNKWNRWGDSVTQTPLIREAHRAGFAAGQVAALEDAANDVRNRGHFGPVVSAAHANWLRARAAELSKETP